MSHIIYRLIFPGVAQFGSALEWGSRGRVFKSPHSDHVVADSKGLRRFFIMSHDLNVAPPLPKITDFGDPVLAVFMTVLCFYLQVDVGL